ncbi:MAG: DUF3307 domain-containing protein [Flavobacteriaceae bacterium]
MYFLILKIALAHLLGDFVFQTNTMVKGIEELGVKSKHLYLHACIHLVLLLIVTGFHGNYIFPVILLSLAHLGIDILTKVVFKNSISSIANFLIDQVLHAIGIMVFVNYFFPFHIAYDLIFIPQNYLLLVSVICITYVSAILIRKLLEAFNFELPGGGIENAGKYIGMLERLFIFMFVVTSFWEGIGFLLAAKSIFRFGDLKEHKEIKLTEYIMIGTLISFGMAIGIGLLYLKLKTLY